MDSYVSEKVCPIPEPFRPNLGRILFISALFFLSFLGRFIFAPLMPTIEQELGITHSQAGSLFLMISLGFFVAQICSGFLSFRVHHKGTLVLSTLGIGLALVLFSVSSYLWFIRTCLILLGMAAGLHIPSAIATITAMVSNHDWGKALAVHQMAPPLSLVLCPLIANLMLGWVSWQVILAIFGVVTLVVGLAFRRFARCGEFPGDAPQPAVVKIVISMRSYWIMVVLFALAMGGSIGLYTMLPLFLVNERGLDVDWANTLLGLSRISGLFMPFVAGWFMGRIGEKTVYLCGHAPCGDHDHHARRPLRSVADRNHISSTRCARMLFHGGFCNPRTNRSTQSSQHRRIIYHTDRLSHWGWCAADGDRVYGGGLFLRFRDRADRRSDHCHLRTRVLHQAGGQDGGGVLEIRKRSWLRKGI